VAQGLAIYVTLGLPALLGTLAVANRALDFFERVCKLRRANPRS
jgi:hypothetical protein